MRVFKFFIIQKALPNNLNLNPHSTLITQNHNNSTLSPPHSTLIKPEN